jgi:hypothetical protein
MRPKHLVEVTVSYGNKFGLGEYLTSNLLRPVNDDMIYDMNENRHSYNILLDNFYLLKCIYNLH